MEIFVEYYNNLIEVTTKAGDTVWDLKLQIQDRTGVSMQNQQWEGLDLPMEFIADAVPLEGLFGQNKYVLLHEKQSSSSQTGNTQINIPSEATVIKPVEPPKIPKTPKKEPFQLKPTQLTLSRVVKPNHLKQYLDSLESDEDRFTYLYEEKFGGIHPNFVGGSFSTWYEACKVDKKPIAIFLADSTMSEVTTRDFCSLAISPDNPDRSLLANVLEANDIPLWVALITKRHAALWKQIFNLQFPHPLFVLAAHMNGAFTILSILSELVLAKDLVIILQHGLQNWIQYCDAENSKMEVIQRNREITEEQDRLYHLSVAEDQKKREQEKKLEDEENLRKMQIHQEWENTIKLLDTLTPEPSASEKSVRIGIRLPEGQRIDRKFNPASKLIEIFNFIAGSYAKSKTGETFTKEAEPTVPWSVQNYYLVQNFPKQTYTTEDANKTISEAQIGGNLFLTKKT